MFIACPVTFILEDAEWFDDIDDAKESALDWSVELSGENVIVYEAIEGNYGYDFKPLSMISA
jgi:hypothetical protein